MSIGDIFGGIDSVAHKTLFSNDYLKGLAHGISHMLGGGGGGVPAGYGYQPDPSDPTKHVGGETLPIGTEVPGKGGPVKVQPPAQQKAGEDAAKAAKAKKTAATTPADPAGQIPSQPYNPSVVDPLAMSTMFKTAIEPYLTQVANQAGGQLDQFSALEGKAAASAPPDVKALLQGMIPGQQAANHGLIAAMQQGAIGSGMWDYLSQQLSNLNTSAQKAANDYLYGQASGGGINGLLSGTTGAATTPGASSGTPAGQTYTPAQMLAIQQALANQP